MKICVYAICKNESKFVERWLDSMQEADYIVVLDTGSTDDTYRKLKADPRVTKVEKKAIKPWRFDVARNESMKLIPEDTDLCVCTDLDEVFDEGWADVVREAWKPGTYRMKYRYAWSHNAVGEPTDVFDYDKMHKYGGYHWKYPVHEVLQPDDPDIVQPTIYLHDSVFLHHYPDKTKSRSFYMDLLKLAVEENPEDCHIQFLYAREYLLACDYDKAIEEYRKCLSMSLIDEPKYDKVLKGALLHTALTYEKIEEFSTAAWYCDELIKEDPTYLEPYIMKAEMYNFMGMFTLAYGCLEAGAKFAKRHFDWVELAPTWNGWFSDVRSVTREHLNDVQGALEDVNAALSHDPDNAHLLKNKTVILERLLKEKQEVK